MLWFAAGCILAPLCAGAPITAAPALAASSDDDTSTAAPEQGKSNGAGSFLDGLATRDTLLGDMGGLRPLLKRYGMTFNLQETSEVLGNVSGGTHRGADYDGLTTMTLQLDTEKAFGWHGGTFNASALQIHGRNLSTDNLQTLQTASGIEANRATRLWELWYQQAFLPDDRLDIKVGQQSLDQEFIVSQSALLFVNTAFGWPILPSVDLPGGGPAYPLSALGVRLRARPVDPLTFLVGVFNGSPAPDNIGDAQVRNPSGTSFPLNGGAMVIAELQYADPPANADAPAGQAGPLPRSYRLGFWYDTERFDDLRYDTTDLSLADPAGNGMPRTHKGNYALYAVADQMIWRSRSEPNRSVNVFIRAMGAPQSDRNLVTFGLNAGATLHDPFPGRDDDTFGIGMGYAKISERASGLDQDTAAFSGAFNPVRGGETFVEVTYQYQVTPWLQLQPDAQYVFMPGGGLPDPSTPGRRIANEAVLGLRTNILF